MPQLLENSLFQLLYKVGSFCFLFPNYNFKKNVPIVKRRILICLERVFNLILLGVGAFVHGDLMKIYIETILDYEGIIFGALTLSSEIFDIILYISFFLNSFNNNWFELLSLINNNENLNKSQWCVCF